MSNVHESKNAMGYTVRTFGMTEQEARRLAEDVFTYIHNPKVTRPSIAQHGYAIQVIDFANAGQYYVALTIGPNLYCFESRERFEDEKMSIY